MKNIFLKLRYLLLAVVMLIACYIYVVIAGNEYICEIDNVPASADIIHPDILVEDEGVDTLEVLSSRIQGSTGYVRLRSKNPGRAFVSIVSGKESSSLSVIYVHKNGVITRDDFFGDFTGGFIVRACLAIYMAVILADMIIRYRRSLKKNIYRSRNILMCGLIIFMAGSFLMNLFNLLTVRNMWFIWIFGNFMNFLELFAILTMPVAVFMAVLATISNIRLLRKEGRTWRNMLAFILSVLLLIATVTPASVAYILNASTVIDVHRWNGTGRFIGMFIENTAGIVVVYFECILAGSIIISVKAARHIPSFDKDYIIILGCQVGRDGKVTKLLQSRADRAVEFASMQKKATGKDLIYIASGGQGSDEVVSEAQAIADYLKSTGIPESSIILEDKSTSTYENFRNSMEIIRSFPGNKDPKIAFSTTNYHVFRSGLLASRLNIRAEGIGSRTRRYFWLNAFIREFIATVYYNIKTHVLVMAVLMLINISVTLMTYMSNVVLS